MVARKPRKFKPGDKVWFIGKHEATVLEYDEDLQEWKVSCFGHEMYCSEKDLHARKDET